MHTDIHMLSVCTQSTKNTGKQITLNQPLFSCTKIHPPTPISTCTSQLCYSLYSLNCANVSLYNPFQPLLLLLSNLYSPKLSSDQLTHSSYILTKSKHQTKTKKGLNMNKIP